MRQYVLGSVRWRIATLFLFGSACAAGVDVTTGREWNRWTKDRYSVIVARVADVHTLAAGANGTHRATLEPLALLAGQLDPSEHPRLVVTFYAAGGGSTSIWGPPRKGAVVLAVVQGTDFIVSDFCTFMPDQQVVVDIDGTKLSQVWKQSSLVEISGLHDPRVLDTLKRIQTARAHPEPNPYGEPTTRPAAKSEPPG